MHRKLLFLAIFLTVFIFHFRVYSDSPSPFIGVWVTQEADSHVEIFKAGSELAGKIVWVKDDPHESPYDLKNPDKALQSRTILGIELMNGFHQDSDDGTKWAGGKIYDPKSGKTYQAKMKLKEKDVIELRGFVGIALLGRTATWTRLKP